MTTLTPHQVRDIAAGTDGVTPGPWKFKAHGKHSEWLGNVVAKLGTNYRGVETIRTITCQTGYGDKTEALATAAHIARLSPEIVSELCAGWLRDHERQGETTEVDAALTRNAALVEAVRAYEDITGHPEPASTLKAIGAACAAYEAVIEAPSLTAAHAAGEREGIEKAAKVAEGPLGLGSPCPYGRDKPGDPTWWHTDKDVCPVCRKTGEDSLYACHENIGPNIATAIRALVPNGEEDGR